MTSRLLRAFAAVFLLFSVLAGALAALQADRGLLDFGAFYMAGVAEERGLDPYGVYPELAAQTGADFGYDDGRGHSPNLNPPISIYPFSLLAGASPGDVKTALNIASAAVFAAAGVALLLAYPQHRNILGVLWIAAFAGLWYTLWLGQVYVLLLAPALGAWFLIQRGTHPLLAGVMIGLLVAVKPNLALLPLFLLLAGHPRIALSGFVTAAGVSAVPLLLEGPGIYGQWLDAIDAYPRIGLSSNASLVGQAERLGVIEAGYVLSALLIAGAALLVWRLRPAPLQATAWGIMVALIAAPVAWIGYNLLALPVLLSRRWGVGEWAAATGLSAIWFVLGRGEVFLAASCLLLLLLLRDQLAGRDLGRRVEDMRAVNPGRSRGEQPLPHIVGASEP